MITDEMVEVACVAAADTIAAGYHARRDGPSKRCAEREMRAALEAVLPMIRAEVLEEQRKRFTDPHAADWYWRDLDPDDSGDSISEAIHMMGEGVVCHVRSSFTGPDFFAAIVPVLDAESDDTEELIADTEEECVRLVKERYAAIRAMKGVTHE